MKTFSNKWRVIHLDGIICRTREHCFPLIMYGFCINNAIYSAGLSFAIFILLLTLWNNFPSYVYNGVISYFIGAIFSKKNVAQVLPKRSYGGVSVKGGSNLLETMKRKKQADVIFYSSLLS